MHNSTKIFFYSKSFLTITLRNRKTRKLNNFPRPRSIILISTIIISKIIYPYTYLPTHTHTSLFQNYVTTVTKQNTAKHIYNTPVNIHKPRRVPQTAASPQARVANKNNLAVFAAKATHCARRLHAAARDSRKLTCKYTRAPRNGNKVVAAAVLALSLTRGRRAESRVCGDTNCAFPATSDFFFSSVQRFEVSACAGFLRSEVILGALGFCVCMQVIWVS